MSAFSSYTSPVCGLDSSSTNRSLPLTIFCSATIFSRSSMSGMWGPSNFTLNVSLLDLNLYCAICVSAKKSECGVDAVRGSLADVEVKAQGRRRGLA